MFENARAIRYSHRNLCAAPPGLIVFFMLTQPYGFALLASDWASFATRLRR
jgi:hypothetical protein